MALYSKEVESGVIRPLSFNVDMKVAINYVGASESQAYQIMIFTSWWFASLRQTGEHIVIDQGILGYDGYNFYGSRLGG